MSSPSRYLEPPVRTHLVQDVAYTARGDVIGVGTPVEIYYGDPGLDPKFHYAIRTEDGRLASAPGSALGLLVEPRRVVSV